MMSLSDWISRIGEQRLMTRSDLIALVKAEGGVLLDMNIKTSFGVTPGTYLVLRIEDEHDHR
jgi:hypothetical protein